MNFILYTLAYIWLSTFRLDYFYMKAEIFKYRRKSKLEKLRMVSSPIYKCLDNAMIGDTNRKFRFL